MKNKIGIFIIFSLSFLYVNAQSVKGVVVDKKGSPLPFANVVQLSKDSTYISGITTDDKGFFILSKVTDAAILRISYVGFQTLFLPVSSIHKDTDLRKIVVEESKSTLSEVVVTGSRPLFRQEDGSLFTQVQGTILSKLPTVDNLLSQLPGAVKGRTGSIEIFGKGSPVIYINKRPIRSYTEVERLQPSDIKNIELITSPGPEFGASGRAVIRITTLRKSEGFSLLSRSNLKQRTYLSGGQSVDLGYQFHKLSIAGNLGYQYSHGRLTQPASTELQIGETLHQYDREQWGATRTPTFNYQLSLDYSINDKHSLGFSFDGSQNTNKEHRNETLNYLTDHQLANSAVVENHYRNKTDYLHVNTFYNGTFGKVNTTLNADYVRNENDYVQNTAESRQSLPLIEANSTGNGKQNLFAVKSDWTWNISPDTKIKWGAGWGYTSNNGNLSIASANDINSDYRTQEHRYALYAETSQKIKNLSLSGGIDLENVNFKYDPHALKTIIDNVILNIPKGKVTAIVGALGSGKTTLIKLMLGYYPALGGKITIGGTDVNTLNKKWWRRQCGVVMQDGVIFSESIARNIAVDDNEIDRLRLQTAAEIACIHDYVMGLPLKYNTKIGRDGVGLSQGQKQRILIARAVYKNPDYIFLDEATNSLDANNERMIVEHLDAFYKGKTVVIVAHRLSTVKNAGQIVVLDKGRVVETGSHEALTRKRGAYYNLVKNQLELEN
ncbi:ATP-binding cassette domain-containing protein [Prevotella denticola]|nr:ATP-binding cassette domain-containing protein [Prevotella denticola]